MTGDTAPVRYAASNTTPPAGTSTTPAVRRRRTWPKAAWYLARRAWMAEIHSYQSIWRLIARRPRVPEGAAGFRYHQPVMPMIVTFLVVSGIELVVVDIVVRQWPAVRLSFLVLGAWGAVWMCGLLCGVLTRPHSVGPAGI